MKQSTVVYNLALPGPWRLQNLIIIHLYKRHFSFFDPFRLHLTSKFAKSANMINNTFFQKKQYGNQEIQFLKPIWIRWKNRKKHTKKVINEMVTEKWSFLRLLLSFRPVTFPGELFGIFFNGFILSIKYRISWCPNQI